MTSPLFDRQATGGVVARDGFEYQDKFLLQHIPLFLSQSAFSHVVSELLGDVEIRYYRPGGGTLCVLYETKRHKLSKADFWKEVAHFLEQHRDSPEEYVRFVLVCGEFNNELQPLLRKLERLRGPGESLNGNSAVRTSAERDIMNTIAEFGQSDDIGRFVLERVTFKEYDDSQVAGGFVSLLEKHLPQVADLRASEVTAFRERSKRLVEGSRKNKVTRDTLEKALVDSAGSYADAWLAAPSIVQLVSSRVSEVESLALDVGLFNGADRENASEEAWNKIRREVEDLGSFLQNSRARRAVHLSAKQRMSMACVLGYCFSATRNFTLHMEHNGNVFDTSVHERASGNIFQRSQVKIEGASAEGVAVIALPYSGEGEVLAACEDLGLRDTPKLFLSSSLPIADISLLNAAVHEAKLALIEFRSQYQLRRIHLFIRVPSVLAMGLGHRLNGAGAIQLYDWVGRTYKPTVELGNLS